MRTTILALTVAALLPFTSGAITIDLNGWMPNNYNGGGQVTGTGIGTTPFNTRVGDILTIPTVANGSYGVDFYHNSGAQGSDFGFTTNAANQISSLTQYGITSVASWDASSITILTYAVEVLTYGVYPDYWYSYGNIPNPHGAGDWLGVMVPGRAPVDMIHNSGWAGGGVGNEDWSFVFNADGTFTTDGVHAFSREPFVLEFNVVPVTFDITPKSGPEPYFHAGTAPYGYDFTLNMVPAWYGINFWWSDPDTIYLHEVTYTPGTTAVADDPAVGMTTVAGVLVTVNASVEAPGNCNDWVDEIVDALCNVAQPPTSQQSMQQLVADTVAANQWPASICLQVLQNFLDAQ